MITMKRAQDFSSTTLDYCSAANRTRADRFDDTGGVKGQKMANRQRQLTELYTAFNERDIPTLLTAMTP
jgi:hypothetical protein